MWASMAGEIRLPSRVIESNRAAADLRIRAISDPSGSQHEKADNVSWLNRFDRNTRNVDARCAHPSMILAQSLCPLNRIRRYHSAKCGLNALPGLDYQSVARNLGEIAACF